MKMMLKKQPLENRLEWHCGPMRAQRAGLTAGPGVDVEDDGVLV
jgi:hypothetical protein